MGDESRGRVRPEDAVHAFGGFLVGREDHHAQILGQRLLADEAGGLELVRHVRVEVDPGH